MIALLTASIDLLILMQNLFYGFSVRHIKDGFIENQLSKSHLISALHNVLNGQFHALNYFPSYEIMMDVTGLSFYKDDMLHPNQVAIDYIWERFVAFLEGIYDTMKEIVTIQNRYNTVLSIHNQKVIKI
jgi:hypothetical protein